MNTADTVMLERLRFLLSRRIRLRRLTLFGSRARGDADAFSDMDVLVVVDGPADDEIRDYISECAWEAGFESGVVVVPVVFTADEWEHGPERFSLLARAVERDGIPA